MSAQSSRTPAYGAGITGALAAEAAFLVLVTAVAIVQNMDPWGPSRMAGALLLGPAAMHPSGFVAGDVLAGLALHAGMAVLVGMLYALLLPRLRLAPITGGMITGIILYVLGFWVLPLLFSNWLAPFWLPVSGKMMQAIAHLFYGFVFGWVYQKRVESGAAAA